MSQRDDGPLPGELQKLRRLAHLLDNLIRLPGGRRIGIDALVGLIPGIGDSLGALASSYIVLTAARLGVPATTLVRMLGNLGLDFFIGLIPFLGDLFDFGWKANARNVALIERDLARAKGGRAGERRLALVTGGIVLLIIGAVVALVVWLVVLLSSLVV